MDAVTAAVDWSLNLQATPITQVHVTSYYEGLIVQGDFCSGKGAKKKNKKKQLTSVCLYTYIHPFKN